MILKKLTLKKNVSDKTYTTICNMFEQQGIFKACGSPDNKYIILQFEDYLDFLAWIIANGMTDVKWKDVE